MSKNNSTIKRFSGFKVTSTVILLGTLSVAAVDISRNMQKSNLSNSSKVTDAPASSCIANAKGNSNANTACGKGASSNFGSSSLVKGDSKNSAMLIGKSSGSNSDDYLGKNTSELIIAENTVASTEPSIANNLDNNTKEAETINKLSANQKNNDNANSENNKLQSTEDTEILLSKKTEGETLKANIKITTKKVVTGLVDGSNFIVAKKITLVPVIKDLKPKIKDINSTKNMQRTAEDINESTELKKDDTPRKLNTSTHRMVSSDVGKEKSFYTKATIKRLNPLSKGVQDSANSKISTIKETKLIESKEVLTTVVNPQGNAINSKGNTSDSVSSSTIKTSDANLEPKTKESSITSKKEKQAFNVSVTAEETNKPSLVSNVSIVNTVNTKFNTTNSSEAASINVLPEIHKNGVKPLTKEREESPKRLVIEKIDNKVKDKEVKSKKDAKKADVLPKNEIASKMNRSEISNLAEKNERASSEIVVEKINNKVEKIEENSKRGTSISLSSEAAPKTHADEASSLVVEKEKALKAAVEETNNKAKETEVNSKKTNDVPLDNEIAPGVHTNETNNLAAKDENASKLVIERINNDVKETEVNVKKTASIPLSNEVTLEVHADEANSLVVEKEKALKAAVKEINDKAKEMEVNSKKTDDIPLDNGTAPGVHTNETNNLVTEKEKALKAVIEEINNKAKNLDAEPKVGSEDHAKYIDPIAEPINHGRQSRKNGAKQVSNTETSPINTLSTLGKVGIAGATLATAGLGYEAYEHKDDICDFFGNAGKCLKTKFSSLF